MRKIDKVEKEYRTWKENMTEELRKITRPKTGTGHIATEYRNSWVEWLIPRVRRLERALRLIEDESEFWCPNSRYGVYGSIDDCLQIARDALKNE